MFLFNKDGNTMEDECLLLRLPFQHHSSAAAVDIIHLKIQVTHLNFDSEMNFL